MLAADRPSGRGAVAAPIAGPPEITHPIVEPLP
jgi:hypothetical protein